MKKSQLTIFMILGLVLIATFAFSLYAKGKVQEIRLQKKVDKIMSDVIHTSAIEYYVTLCLENSLKKGINTLLKQGGYIFKYQNGTALPESAPDPFGLPYNVGAVDYYDGSETYKVAMLSFNDVEVNGLNYAPPIYPCNDFYGIGVSPGWCQFIYDLNKNKSYSYGSDILPALCYGGATKCLFEDTLGFQPSIQKQLEVYIANHTKQCVEFEKITGFNETYSIEEGNVTAFVSFSESTVEVTLDFPILITVGNKPPVTRILNFYASQHARITDLYRFIREIIRYDNKEYLPAEGMGFEGLSFNLLKNFTHLAYYKPYFSVDVVPRITEDIIIIKDEDSLIDNKPLTMQFARENHVPVLDYISFPKPNLTYSNFYDIIVQENDTINITPLGHDADEDLLTYKYGAVSINDYDRTAAWRARYYEDYSNNMTVPLGTQIDDFNHWETSDSYINGTGCVNPETGSPQPNRCASYKVQEVDFGPHNLTVAVFDDSGLRDFQLLRILVDDMVKAVAVGQNPYSDVQNDYASVEDPYMLDASLSRDEFILEDWTYKWVDQFEPNFSNGTLYYGFDPTIWLPIDVDDNFSDFNITNIKGPFTNTSTGSLPYLKHRISLEVFTGTRDTDYWDVKVAQCLPHRLESAPWPYTNYEGDDFIDEYNMTVSDPFQANHTCCQAGDNTTYGRLYGTSTTCYEIEQNWCGYPDTSSVYPPGTLALRNDAPTPSVLNCNDPLKCRNKIFERAYTQKCDGTRGNICNGTITDVWNLTPAGNCTYNSSYDEQCSGCVNYNRTTNETSCTLFDGTTFEFEAGITGSNGACQDTFKCSTPTLYDVPEGIWGSCQGTCDGFGTCTKPINCDICSTHNEHECVEYNATMIVWGCNVTATGHNKCDRNGAPDINPEFIGCRNPWAAGSDFCNGTAPALSQCGPGECCNRDATSFLNCFDPCEDKAKPCSKRVCGYDPNDPFGGGTYNDTCEIQGENSTDCNELNINDLNGKSGFCNSTDPDFCSADLADEMPCTDDAQCNDRAPPFAPSPGWRDGYCWFDWNESITTSICCEADSPHVWNQRCDTKKPYITLINISTPSINPGDITNNVVINFSWLAEDNTSGGSPDSGIASYKYGWSASPPVNPTEETANNWVEINFSDYITNGELTVFFSVIAMDNAHWWSDPPEPINITIDIKPPEECEIIVDGSSFLWPNYTRSVMVNLTFGVMGNSEPWGASQYRISNDNNTFSPWYDVNCSLCENNNCKNCHFINWNLTDYGGISADHRVNLTLQARDEANNTAECYFPFIPQFYKYYLDRT
ncbi:MAG: hypothetical protein D6797_04400, partial [Bdellovibrio sp.]